MFSVSRDTKLISLPLIIQNDVSYARPDRLASRRSGRVHGVVLEFRAITEKSSSAEHLDRISPFASSCISSRLLVVAFSLGLECLLSRLRPQHNPARRTHILGARQPRGDAMLPVAFEAASVVKRGKICKGRSASENARSHPFY